MIRRFRLHTVRLLPRIWVYYSSWTARPFALAFHIWGSCEKTAIIQSRFRFRFREEQNQRREERREEKRREEKRREEKRREEKRREQDAWRKVCAIKRCASKKDLAFCFPCLWAGSNSLISEYILWSIGSNELKFWAFPKKECVISLVANTGLKDYSPLQVRHFIIYTMVVLFEQVCKFDYLWGLQCFPKKLL